MNYEMLFRVLYASGVRADGEVPAPPPVAVATPWVARILLGICGWIAGILALSALGALFASLFNSEAVLAVVALICIGAAATLYSSGSRNELFLQFGLAVSITGQICAAAAIIKWLPERHATAAFCVAAVQAGLVVLMRNGVHRFLSTLFAVAALAFAARELHDLPHLYALASTATVLVWLAEPRWQCSGWGEVLRPVAYALSGALICLPLGDPDALFWQRAARVGPAWLAALAWAPAWGLLLWHLGARARVECRLAAGAAGIGLVALAAVAPGMTASALVVLLGFAAGSPLLVGEALIATIAYLGVFYQLQLQTTLLVKSEALVAAGLGCWIAWGVVRWLAREGRP